MSPKWTKRPRVAVLDNLKQTEMKSIKFQGETVTLRKTVNQLLRVHKVAKPVNDNWYLQANHLCREIAKEASFSAQSPSSKIVEPIRVAGIIAALSPQKSWPENIRLAEDFILKGSRKGHTGVMIGKAKAIWALPNHELTPETIVEILNGPKISSFFLNIYQPYQSQAVTIDRHAVDAAMGKVLENKTMTVNQYRFFELAYQTAAVKIGIKGSELQAIVWEEWRAQKGLVNETF